MGFFLDLEFACCFFMTGLIWVIQLVHYPSFRFAEKNQFLEFSAFHQRRISWIVAPVMTAELTFNLYNLGWRFESEPYLALISTVCLVLIWVVTFFVSVPCHSQLNHGYDEDAVTRLIRTNWLRTALWSVRSCSLFVAYSMA